MIKKISALISGMFNPIFSLLFYYIVYNYITFDNATAIKNILMLFIGIVLPIGLYIFVQVKRGKFTNMDVSHRQQRYKLYYVILGLLLANIIIVYITHKSIDREALFLLLLIIIMMISNFWIKSSMHTSLNIFVAALFYHLNPCWGLIWLLISVIVAITRVILKKHTPAEVISGMIIGSVISIIYILT